MKKNNKLKGKAIRIALTLTIAMVFGAVGMLPGVMQTGHAAMYYDVYIDDGISNGVVSTDKSETSGSGETVTLTVNPGDGYKLKKLSVIQPNVLNSISELVALMGDAVFSLENEYFVKVDEGKFSVFHYDEKIASLDNSENFTNQYGAGGNYTANTENSGFWRFYIIGGKLRKIEFSNSNNNLTFEGIGAETITGTEIATTVTEDGKYTFTAPVSDVFVTAEFEMLDPKTVLIDVGKGHAALFTSDVLNDIKSKFELTAVTINGNIIKLEGVNPSNSEYDLWSAIDNYLEDLLWENYYYKHNGERFFYTAYKPIDKYASEDDVRSDIYDDSRDETPVSNNLTYYLLWKKPYTKLEMDNGNPACGKAAKDAKPTVPEGILISEIRWEDANDERVDSFEVGKEYKFNGYLEIDEEGSLWRYFIDPSNNFTLTVKGGEDVNYDFLEGSLVRVTFKATADHDWDEGTITKQPTETADGEKTFKCKHCGATKTEAIPKLNPAAPKVKTMTKTSAMTMTVKWTMKWGKVNGAKSYKVAYRKAGSKKWTYKKTKKTKYVVKGHKAKGLYEYKVAAVTKKGNVWSKTSRRYFDGVKIKAKAGKGSVKVSWKKAKGASGYQIQVATNKKMKNAKKITVSSSAKSYKVKGLKSGKKYYVKVRPLKKYKGATYNGTLSKVKSVKAK